jgi:hypothetical protein
MACVVSCSRWEWANHRQTWHTIQSISMRTILCNYLFWQNLVIFGNKLSLQWWENKFQTPRVSESARTVLFLVYSLYQYLLVGVVAYVLTHWTVIFGVEQILHHAAIANETIVGHSLQWDDVVYDWNLIRCRG